MEWHRCRRWWKMGIGCPFGAEEEHDDDDDDEQRPTVTTPDREEAPDVIPVGEKRDEKKQDEDGELERVAREVIEEVPAEVPYEGAFPKNAPWPNPPWPFPARPDQPKKVPVRQPVHATGGAQLGGGATETGWGGIPRTAAGGSPSRPGSSRVPGLQPGGATPGLIHAPNLGQAARTTMNLITRAAPNPGAMGAPRPQRRSVNAGVTRPTNAARLFSAAETATVSAFYGAANTGAPVRSGRSVGAIIESLTNYAARPSVQTGSRPWWQRPPPPIGIPGRRSSGRAGRSSGGGGYFFESAARQMGNALYF